MTCAGPRRCALAALTVWTLAMGTVQAAAPPRGEWRHRVQAGDTLQSLGERYLRTPSRWRELQALNPSADPVGTLDPGSVVRVPRALLRPATLATAKVEFVQGQALALSPPFALHAGDALTEGARIHVPPDGYLRLRLADGSVLRVLADSDVELKRLRSRRATGAYESAIKVQRGKVESEVERQPRGRLFEIHAPGAVASVRGTRFAVAVAPDGRVSTAVSQGVVKVQPRTPAGRPRVRGAELQAGEGAVVEADGRLHKRRTLPAPPALSSLPALRQDADRLLFRLPAPDAGLDGYEVRITRAGDLREVLHNGRFTDGDIRFPPLDDGDYLMHVRAIDGDGLGGPEAQHAFRVHARPVPPLYQSPAPGARIGGEAGQLVCAEVAGSAGVRLQVSATAGFERPVLDDSRSTGCRVGVGMLPPGTYWWRVASLATDASGATRPGPFAEPQRFTLAPTPGITGLALDESGENPTLHWHAEPGQTFRAQLSQDPDFGTLLRDVELDSPHWTLAGLARGHYQVRLQARDAAGLSGPFSPARRVRVGAVVRTSNGEWLGASDGTPIDRP